MDLACFGGAPSFQHPVHVAHASVAQRERFFGLLDGVFDRGHFTNDGPLVLEFEARLCERLGVKHCVATCNATAGLEIAARALGMRRRAIVPAFTFVATAHALQWQGIRPAFCDIDARSHALDTASMERMLSPDADGIVGVHLWGRACDVEAVGAIARRRRLPLLFDAAQAFGATHDGRNVGSFGDAEVFSFHATKFFHTFEGGAVVTNHDDVAVDVRRMRNFGFTDYDKVDGLGINAKMSEVSAAMGLAGLETLDQGIADCRARYVSYARELKEIPGIALVNGAPAQGGNCQYIVIEVDHQACGLSRDQLLALLRAEKIYARRYFYPGCHRMEPYRTFDPDAPARLPNTERVAARVLALPTNERMDAVSIERLCNLIRFAATHGAAIAARMDS